MHAETTAAEPAGLAAATVAEVARKIRARMGELRISMSALSRTTGIHRATLTNQIDNCGVNIQTLVLIAKALDASPADFLPEDESARASA